MTQRATPLTETDMQLLEKLTTIPAVAGHEDEMIDFVYDWMQPYADELRVDGIGNVIATVRGRAETPKLMVSAHMDEVGLCVKRIHPNGFLKVDRIGGINRKALVARPVILHTSEGKQIPGSIGVMAHHLTPDADRFKVPDVGGLYLDIGARSAEEVLAWGVRVGNPITYTNTFQPMGEGFLRARALDNRIGLFVLLKTLAAVSQAKPAGTLYAVATVQEEFNVRGSIPPARTLEPDANICLDVAMGGDTPDLEGENNVVLGGGPVYKMMMFHGRGTLGGLIPNPKLQAFMEKVGEDLDIATQKSASIGGLTEASFLQLEGNGIPAMDLGIPMRYAHSPIEMVHLADVADTINLVTATVQRLDAQVDLTRGRIAR